jgi:uncharacterized protein YyaL (SSP411 family)
MIISMSENTNRLIHETSPYLRQHAHNPVDWYPWGEEALQRARELDRPIFLSIGYSACHWCHVMEHESFEDAEVADILNRHFISIKVDREERPDLDQIYMAAVQLMTRQGGWPMSMFLTPDLQPFYGGTYFPPDDRYGRPGFKRLLITLAKTWQEERQAIHEQAGHVTEHVRNMLHLESAGGELGVELLRNAVAALSRSFDHANGGFGSAPKFPHPLELRLLLRCAVRFDDDDVLGMVKQTLDHMARGGMYEQLGGGFHRYSTDERWLVPHFEKMLYDNSLLASAYVEAYQVTGEPYYRQVVEETLAYVLREMTSPEGPFYSTQDADSEGVEGKFFVWSRDEVQDVLGPDAELFCSIYDVTGEGNWEGHNILHLARGLDQEARMLGIAEEDLRRRLEGCKQKLLQVRNQRVWPGRDEKFLTSWNGLMIAALAKAYQVLERPEYLQAAIRAADYILTNMCSGDGRLLRTAGAASPAKLNAYLEDYTFMQDALVTLYEASFEPRWLTAALDLARITIEQFWDDAEGGFFYTGKDHEQLIARTKDPHDSSVPSGNSLAVLSFLRLAKLTGRRDLWDKADKTLRLFRDLMVSSPMAAPQMLSALDFFLGPVQEAAVVGDSNSEETQKALRIIRRRFRPNMVLAFKAAGDETTDLGNTIPLLAGKTAQGTVTTYICRDFACQKPIVGAADLANAEW